MPGEVERKYGGLLEKKWTSVIRLQKKVRPRYFSPGHFATQTLFVIGERKYIFLPPVSAPRRVQREYSTGSITSAKWAPLELHTHGTFSLPLPPLRR